MKFGILLFILLFSSSCIYQRGQIVINYSRKSPLDINISNIQISNHQIILTGTNLNVITNAMIKDGGTTVNLEIESKSNTTLVANTLSNATLAIEKLLDLVVSNANAAATYNINFSLCDSLLNGASFNCTTPPTDKEILSYDANSGSWKPRSVSGLSYQGVWDASGGLPTSGGPAAAGEYYLISVAGNGYSVGDWTVDNGSTFERIDNSTAVNSVFGRTGLVVAQEGDYSLGQLSNVDTNGQTSGQFLRYNGTQWVPSTVSVSETDPTVSAFAKMALPTCATGEVLKSNGSTFICVTDATGGGGFTGTPNRVVITNGPGALSVSTISDTILGYLSGTTSNIQTQIDSKAASSSIVDWSSHSVSGPYIHPTRVYGGSVQGSKTLVTDSSGNIVTSNVTPTELGYLSGVTSNIQTQISAISSPWTAASGNVYRSSGSVGIGVTSPTSPLDVRQDYSGNTNFIGTNFAFKFQPSTSAAYTSTGLKIYNDFNPSGFTYSSGTHSGISATAAVPSGFITGTVVGGVFTADGNVTGFGSGSLKGISAASYNSAGIYTSSFGGDFAAGTFSGGLSSAYGVRALVSQDYGSSLNSITDAYGLYTGVTKTSAGGIANAYGVYINNVQGGTLRYSLYANDSGAPSYFAGSVGIGNTSPTYKLDVTGDVRISSSNSLYFGTTAICTSSGCTVPSDQSLKHSISTLNNSVDRLMTINGVSYFYKDVNQFGNKKQIGLLAQNVEKAFPEVVKTDLKTGLKSIAYDHLVAPIIEAIKEIVNDKTRNAHEIQKLKEENAMIKNYICKKDPLADFCI